MMNGSHTQRHPDATCDTSPSCLPLRVTSSRGGNGPCATGSGACDATWRVLIAGGGSLLASVICDLLSKQSGLQINRLRDSAESMISREAARIQPHAIILAGIAGRSDALRLLTYLDAGLAARIIAFDPNDNRVLIYDVKPATVDTVDDLMSIIKNE
jgi:hypothetical protein